MSTLDYSIIGAYFVVLLSIGFALRRMAAQSMESYFLAGNKLPWWMLGVSGMGYSLDIAGTMLIISLLYLMGPRGLFIEFRGGVSLALLCQMIWTGKWHRRSGCMTVAEWMTFRFGESPGASFARLATAVCFIVFAGSMLVYMAKGVGLFLSLFIPLSPFVCALLLLGIATLYTAMSGLYGVVVSDLFQCGLIVFGAFFVMWLAVDALGNGVDLPALAAEITGQQNWSLSYPNVFEPNMPQGYEQYENMLLYTMFFLVLNKLIIGGFGTGHEPQFFAARDERECGKLAALWAVLMTFRWPMMISYAVLGLLMVQDFFPDPALLEQAAEVIRRELSPTEAQWPEMLATLKNSGAAPTAAATELQSLLGDDWRQKLDLVSYHGTVNGERILPSVLLHKVGPGFRGLILVTLISASMSTFDMTMNKAAAMFTNDIYRRFLRPEATTQEMMRATYAFFGVMLAAAFGMAYFIPNINTIWGWITMGLWSGIGMPLLLRFYWWRFNGAGFAAGVFGGLAAAVAVLFWNTFAAQGDRIQEVGQFLLLTPVSLACCIAGTFLAPRTDEATLTNFYRKTRPFGLWAPLRAVLSPEEDRAARTEHRNDLIALPFGFVWMVSMYLAPMQLVTGDYPAFWVTSGLFLVGAAGLYRFWYRALPPPSTP